MSNFPDVLVVVNPRLKRAKLLTLKKATSVQLLGYEETKLLLAPDFIFKLSEFGETPAYIAAKLKQDYVVLVNFGVDEGMPITLGEKFSPSFAAPLLVYEVKKALGEIRS